MVFQNNILAGVGGQSTGDPGYEIDYSCRFDVSSDSYLLFSPTSNAAAQKTYTLSAWVKRGNLNKIQTVIGCSNSAGTTFSYALMAPNTAVDDVGSSNSGTAYNLYNTNIVFRDPTAWFHIMLTVDTTQALANERVSIFLNGIKLGGRVNYPYTTYTQPSLNATMQMNTTIKMGIGRLGDFAGDVAFDGYISQAAMVTELALPPTSFGEFDSNGVWRPVDITGLDYSGENSFLLDFADSSALGNDVSGNNNDFTPTNLGTDDQVTDTPTKNFCTLNSIDSFSVAGTGTLSNGSLTWSHTNTGGSSGTMIMTGKTYWEVTCNASVSSYVGIIRNSVPTSASANAQGITGDHTGMVTYDTGGSVYKGATLEDTYATWASGDVIGIAYDPTVPDVEFFKNNSSEGSITLDAGNDYQPWVGCAANTCSVTANFGQLAFTYTPPAGFESLNTSNLTESTIKNGKKYFDTILYEGNSAGQKIGQFQPITEAYSVDDSALVIKGDSTELRKTWSTTASSTKDGTFSCWLKVGVITGSAGGYIITCGGGSGDFIKINTSDKIHIQLNNESNGLWTSGEDFENRTQWTHLVVSYDLDNSGGDADRLKIYRNGVEITANGTFGSTIDDLAFKMNQDTQACAIGGVGTGSTDYMYDGYLAEVVWCDGQVLTPSSFGEVDSTTNRWIPKDVSGLTFGNNGFYLDFADKNALGDDESGNTNDWTTTGFDTTNGSNQFHDTPTLNFPILDPQMLSAYGSPSISTGNLVITEAAGGGTSQPDGVQGCSFISPQSGKWYWEMLCDNLVNAYPMGFIFMDNSSTWAGDTTPAETDFDNMCRVSSGDNDLRVRLSSSTDTVSSVFGSSPATGDVIQFAVDMDSNLFYVGLNNTWATATGDPASGVGISFPFSDIPGSVAGINVFNGAIGSYNFGQWEYWDSTTLTESTDAGGYFRFTPPTDFKALQVDNLTESASFTSAMSWIKNRSAADSHMLFDRPRGRFKSIEPDAVDVEVTDVDSLQRFLKQGATIGDNDAINTKAESFVYWDWFIETTGAGSANEDGATNTTATLVDTTSGISISTYTGTGGATTLGHGLGVAPEFIIQKKRTNDIASWHVYHKNMTTSSPEDYYITLDASSIAYDEAGVWNDTAPTSTLISLGSGVDMNDTGDTFVIYAFVGIEGFSKFSHYLGNNSAEGPFIATGFKPAWVMIKRTTTTNGDWLIYDSNRSAYNQIDDQLVANDPDAETTGSEELDFTANGFKIRTTDAQINANAANYIFAAFASNPFGGSSTTPSPAY